VQVGSNQTEVSCSILSQSVEIPPTRNIAHEKKRERDGYANNDLQSNNQTDQ